MLRRLYIRDYAIVDELELDFEHGFGALTGETGAGKSILVDALSLALGERTEADVVRAGRERAEISAEFELPGTCELGEWLVSSDLEAEPGICLLRRVIDARGRSRAYINGAPTTAAQLRVAGERLCDIHGQHAHQALLRTDAQRSLLDAFGGLSAQSRNVADLFREWREALKARESAERDVAANARERDALEWQVQELQGIAFDPQQWQETLLEHRRLAHAETLLQGVEAAIGILDDGDSGVTARTEALSSRLAALVEYDHQLRETHELIDSARIQLNESAYALRRYREHLDLDTDRLSMLESRIQVVDETARKYRTVASEIPSLLQQMQARLAALQYLADPAAWVQREGAARSEYLLAATELSQGRRNAAGELSRRVTEAMQEIAMIGGRFEVALQPLSDGGAGGLELVEFRVSTHAAQPVGALTKVASGGELSRIGLAMQVIASTSGGTPTLIFDEVDVGIGGRVAEIVGRLLRQLGTERQVLCVTHLPQVAAQAHWHWSVAKEGVDGQVVSRVSQLDDDGRVEEIARMLGGVNVTATTRRHAKEMLNDANAAAAEGGPQRRR